MPVNIPTITPMTLPTPSRLMAQQVFSQAVATALAELATAFPQMNAFVTAVNAAALEFDAEMAVTQAARTEAQTARTEAVLLVNTPMWNSATNYPTGTFVKSPTNLELYTRKAPGGTNSTDPAVDGTQSFWSKAPILATVPTPVYITGAKTFGLTDIHVPNIHQSTDTSARTVTIPSNAAVKFPETTTLTLVNQFGAGIITINITSDTLRLAGTGATGTRTLAAGGMCSIMKVAPTEWMISGIGVA